jgi:tetratricopeptide (TPR) repeat protein
MKAAMDTLSAYVLEQLLGRGTMGEVWRARAPDGTPVAVKIAREGVLDNPRMLKHMDGEVRAMARLDHPHVTWVYDHGRTSGGRPYLVLEHCGDGTLAERRPSSWEGVRELALLLLDALGHAHAHGIIHRDLKPANVLWSGPSDVRPGPKLADFGIAFAMGLDSRLASVAGTPWYMAPEQALRDCALGPWTDLYALGVVLWELCTGTPPYYGPDVVLVLAAARAGRLPPFEPRFDVPPSVLPWLKRLLARQPAERFQRAADAQRALGVDTGLSWRAPERAGPRLRLQGAGLGLLPLRELELAGREAERDQLWETLLRVRSRAEPEVVVLRGVSGIGKTRLGAWMCERASELGLAQSVRVPCRGSAPLMGLLVGLLRHRPPGLLGAGADEIVAALRQLSLPDHVLDRLGELLLGPHTRWGAVPAVHRALRALAVQPRIVLLDDAHASESAVRLARALLSEREPVPLLLVLSIEEDALESSELRDLVDGLEGQPRVTTLRLGPLSGPDQDRLLDTLVGLSPEAHSALLGSGGGHPGYLVARVSDWVSQGVLQPTPRGFALRAAAVPEGASLAELWERRLAELARGLPPEALGLLERAATQGREVDEELWEAACDDPSADLRGSGQLQVAPDAVRVRIELVDRLLASGVAHETEMGFTFSHPALVDALLQSARAGGRLVGHHVACAVQVAQRPMPQHALALGHHLASAGQWLAATDALLEGLDWAWQRADRRPLLAEVERAERCADQAGLAAADARRIRLQLVRAALLLGVGRMEDAEACARTGMALAEQLGDRTLLAQATMRMCDVVPLQGDWRGAVPWFTRFLQLEDAAPKPYWAGIVRARLGKVAEEDGQHEQAERWYEEAEQILLSCDQTQPQVVTGLVELYSFRHQSERALAQGLVAEQIVTEAGMVMERAYVLFRRHEALRRLERYEEATDAISEAIGLAEQVGDLRGATLYRGQLVLSLIAQERFAQAHGALQQALERVSALRNVWLEAMLHLLDLQMLYELRRLDELDHRLQQLERLAERVPRSERQIREGLLELGRRLREEGELARAERCEQVAEL